jgi:hypothetical protein
MTTTKISQKIREVVNDRNIFLKLYCILLLHFNRITTKNSQKITEVEKGYEYFFFNLDCIL